MDCITITSDDVYFNHCYTFLKSLEHHSKDIHVFLRCVNMSLVQMKTLESVYNGLEIIDDQIGLSRKKHKLKDDMSWQWVGGLENIKGLSYTYSDHMCYTNNMRFDNICTVLSRSDINRVINMDIDQIFINNFTFDELFIDGLDILTFNENDQGLIDCNKIADSVWIPDVWITEGYETNEPLIDESMLAIRKNDKTMNYFELARDMIHDDFYNWDADFRIINQLYKMSDVKVSTPDLKFIDRWFYHDDSVIWNGAGNNRNTNKKYKAMHDRYIKDRETH